MKQIGITTTVPIEILLAAGYQPVDLNNVFISDPDPGRLVAVAEKAGFPINCCSWIKGIYGVCMERRLDNILCVTTGDCSNTIMLMEVLKLKRPNVLQFAYPQSPDVKQVQQSLESLAGTLGTTLRDAEKVRAELKPCRDLALKLDELTWERGIVSGFENHYWLVSASDFNQDYQKYNHDVAFLLTQVEKRTPYPTDWLRIAYIGVPSVYGKDLYHFLEKNEARVVFNEVQRQFAMPNPGKSMAEQYANYTYPYSIYGRVEDIRTELKRRHIDGVIHYVQAFCHRGIGDIIFRSAIDVPILTLEGNDDFFLTQHVQTRVEAFLDMLRHSRQDIKRHNRALV